MTWFITTWFIEQIQHTTLNSKKQSTIYLSIHWKHSHYRMTWFIYIQATQAGTKINSKFWEYWVSKTLSQLSLQPFSKNYLCYTSSGNVETFLILRKQSRLRGVDSLECEKAMFESNLQETQSNIAWLYNCNSIRKIFKLYTRIRYSVFNTTVWNSAVPDRNRDQ